MAIILYGHGGSRNHGCEAIVRSTIGMLGTDITTYTTDIQGDRLYGLDSVTTLKQMHSTTESFVARGYSGLARRAFKDYGPLIRFQYKDLMDFRDQIMISVGGDNYCNGHPYSYMEANKLLSKKNKTVLWGCSVTPSLFKDKKIIEDMNRYSMIVARESLTFEAIKNSGVSTDSFLLPDPAFTLETKPVDLPKEFEEGNTIGINLSPLVENASCGDNLVFSGVKKLINYILLHTDYKVALIPHVVWKKSDDLVSLYSLYEGHRDSDRVFIVDPSKMLGCRELKYIISKCKMMIAARTHASIAAYSSCVPTLVLGYSVKSKGIAKDIFGTEENYVLPVQGLKSDDSVIDAYLWLEAHCEEVQSHLKSVMPQYIERSRSAGKVLLDSLSSAM